MAHARSNGRVVVGVLRAELAVPGARTLKDRRQVLRSLVDRLRHRFDVSCHELTLTEHPGSGAIVVSTAGGDGALIRQTFDSIAGILRTSPSALVTRLDSEVFPWHPSDRSWADIWSPDELSGDDAPWATEGDDE
jgi:uncharacterized protein YlxP (DUF503 family)